MPKITRTLIASSIFHVLPSWCCPVDAFVAMAHAELAQEVIPMPADGGAVREFAGNAGQMQKATVGFAHFHLSIESFGGGEESEWNGVVVGYILI